MKQVNSQRKERRIIRMAQLREKFPLSESHIYSLIKQGLFPKPFPLVPGGRAVGWYEDTVDDYLSTCEINALGGE
jgi:predicted DNA-binding transcriptional regulator AlpA